MKTLCMDSAHKQLIIVLLDDGEVVAGTAFPCFKRQSEALFPELISCMEKANWTADDIDEVMISDGPGSYTGVRIAMSVAKVLCTQKHIPLYCISTIQLYAGMLDHVFVMLDARSNRAYVGEVHQGKFVCDEQIMTLEEIKAYVEEHSNLILAGDCELIGKESIAIDFIDHMKSLRASARKIENIHILTPRYLKEQDAYKVK